jgi:hypothetical protein
MRECLCEALMDFRIVSEMKIALNDDPDQGRERNTFSCLTEDGMVEKGIFQHVYQDCDVDSVCLSQPLLEVIIPLD